jgi:tetratricopeptide (TPR) repeat protein
VRPILESEAVSRRHADYFSNKALEAESALLGPEQDYWLSYLGIEYDNLKSVFTWAADSSPLGIGLPVALALHRFWDIRGPLSEGRDVIGSFLPHATARDRERGRALYVAAAIAHRLQKSEERDHCIAESVAIFRDVGERYWLARALILRANGLSPAEMKVHYEEALQLFREIGHQEGVASALNNLGIAAWEGGERVRAWGLYEESLKIKREIGARSAMTNTLNNLGDASLVKRDWRAAAEYYSESLQIARELGASVAVATTLSYLGDTYVLGEIHDPPDDFYEQSWSIWKNLRDEDLAWYSYLIKVRVALRCNDSATARSLLRKRLSDPKMPPNQADLFRALIPLARVAAFAGKCYEAAILLAAIPARETALRVIEESEYEACLEIARANLAAPRFDIAWKQGTSMNLESVIQGVLSWL